MRPMMNPQLRAIGDQIVRELMGADDGGGGGFGGGGLDTGLNLLNEGLQRGYKAYQSKKDTEKDQNNLNDAISADAKWADTEKMVELLRVAKDQHRISAAQGVASAAQSAAMTAGNKLSDDAKVKRAQAARDSATAAAHDALVYPRDMVKQANMRAWQKVSAAVAASAGGTSAMTPSGSGALPPLQPDGNWFTNHHAGVPTWGWILLGAGGLTALTLIIKAVVKK